MSVKGTGCGGGEGSVRTRHTGAVVDGEPLPPLGWGWPSPAGDRAVCGNPEPSRCQEHNVPTGRGRKGAEISGRVSSVHAGPLPGLSARN